MTWWGLSFPFPIGITELACSGNQSCKRGEEEQKGFPRNFYAALAKSNPVAQALCCIVAVLT